LLPECDASTLPQETYEDQFVGYTFTLISGVSVSHTNYDSFGTFHSSTSDVQHFRDGSSCLSTVRTADVQFEYGTSRAVVQAQADGCHYYLTVQTPDCNGTSSYYYTTAILLLVLRRLLFTTKYLFLLLTITLLQLLLLHIQLPRPHSLSPPSSVRCVVPSGFHC
jgi:hypothetical protein